MTSVVDPVRMSRCLQVYEDTVCQKGIKVFIGFDFHEYVSITRATPTKEPTYPSFRPDRSPIKSGEGYWIMGLDQNNHVAILAAQRLYDLSHSNFAEHLQSLKVFYADPTVHAHPQDRCICIAPTAKKMTGKIAFHGDYWIRKDFRGKGLSKFLARMAQGVSFAMWDPNFLCGFVERWLLDKSLVEQCGYAHHEAGGSILQLVEHGIVDDELLVWRTGQELRSQFGLHTSELFLAPSLSGARPEVT